MTYEYPFIANYLLLKLYQNENQLVSLEVLKENQNFRTDLNEQCLADLQEDNLISEITLSKIKFYQITTQGLSLLRKSVENGLQSFGDMDRE